MNSETVSQPTALITPGPEHHTVGKRFKGWDGFHYFCDSYDPRCGYWMTNEATQERKNVSERAIGATFHQACQHVIQ